MRENEKNNSSFFSVDGGNDLFVTDRLFKAKMAGQAE